MSRVFASLRWFLLILIVFLAGYFLVRVAQQDSATFDERAHIPAGYSYARYLDYRLNPEHPPLVKALAGLPLLFSSGGKDLIFPIHNEAWQTAVNGQWDVGSQFLYESGNNADQLIFLARLGPILLTLLAVLAVYFLASMVVGRWWGLLPAFLFAFSPTALAHGHYVTTDMGATLGILLSIWTFLSFLSNPSKKMLLLVGVAFGIAQLMKFSSILLAPYFILLIIIFYLASVLRDWASTEPGRRWHRFLIRGWEYLRAVLIIFLIGLILIYVVYFFFTLGYPKDRQAADTQTILSNFAPSGLVRSLTLMAGNPVLRPLAEYALGLAMVVHRSTIGNTFYFFNELAVVGTPWYFPLVFLMKESLPSLIFILGAMILGIMGLAKATVIAVFRKFRPLVEYLNTHFSEFAMLIFVALYWWSSIRSHLNIGVRHLLPVLPFMYILATNSVRKWFGLEDLSLIRNFVLQIFILARGLFSLSLKSAIVGTLLVWYLLSTAIAYPHFLSYFNIAAGGTANGYRWVTDSNYDWGQDLKRLKIWVDQNLPAGGKIAVDYFGGGDPKYYLGSERVEPWWSARGNPINENIHWLAVSINTLQGAKAKKVEGFIRKPEDEYQWLENYKKPYARAGPSIFIYKLD